MIIKIKYIIKLSEYLIIIYTDHRSSLKLAK